MHFSERVNRASHKKCGNSDNKNDQNIYAFMSRMYDNDESPGRNFCDSSQLIN